MTKYDEQFKQQVVSAYLRGDSGFDALAARHGIHSGMLQRWVAAYRAHGRAGLQSKYSSYDAPFKLRVLQHMQRDELSLREVSALYDIRDAGDLPPANRASWSLVKFVFGEKTNMKKRFTEQQIIGFLKEAEAGMPVKELCRKHGFSDASFYTWRAKFGGMEVSEARRLK
ncbi:transposase, partial [Burkholderia cenocepacia]|uniref:transposase n=1 Tax=Burkholderia cenocepacia TaxID=95486 RepID=UPI00209BB689